MPVLVMCALVSVSFARPTAQRSGQTGASFKAGILVVQVDAVVVDAQDRPVTYLSKADFRILEDGRPQQISQLLVVTPPETTAQSKVARLVARDVTSNDTV
ncbi:MAG TPA: hypothetical protein VK911_04815, partial [Vicinamibacterales bacterium]|nr:hypothetical protein [Vicinamibacterales bacterium]